MEKLEAWLRGVESDCLRIFAERPRSPQDVHDRLEELQAPPRASELASTLAGDMLAPETRLVRRNLLVSATVSVLVSIGGRPNGLVMFDLQRQWLPILAAGAVTLFLLAEFLVYVRSDQDRHAAAVRDRDLLVELLANAVSRLDLVRDAIGKRTADQVAEHLSAVSIPAVPPRRAYFDFSAPRLWGVFSLGSCIGALLSTFGLRLMEHLR